MKTIHVFILSALLFMGFSCPANAQVGQSLRKLATEVVELIAKKGGEKSLKELSAMGGEAAVKEVLEKAAREGGDDLVQTVVRYSKSYGLDGFRAIADNPKVMTKALDGLPRNLALKGVTEASRNPKLMTDLVLKYGDEVLEVSARHPGVGSKVINGFGDAGISAGRVLSTDDMILLSRQSKSFSRLPAASKRTFLEILETNPKVVLTYLAGTSATATAVVLTVGGVDNLEKVLLGTPDAPGPLIKPIIFWSWIGGGVLLLICLGFCAPKIYGLLRREAIQTDVAQAKGDAAVRSLDADKDE